MAQIIYTIAVALAFTAIADKLPSKQPKKIAVLAESRPAPKLYILQPDHENYRY